MSGDADTTNNEEWELDTVRSSYDPNFIMAKPGGCLASGVAANQLQYVIHFENTGNDTARNIYVLDTLPDNVDVSTMRMEMASHEMYISKLKAGGHHVLKFDFPGINLADSSHHGYCDGAVIFNIKTRSGLATGATIKNRAGIYFDDNEVVMTNEAVNTIGCPITSVSHLQQQDAVGIYPNPAFDEFNIDIKGGSYSTCTITNTFGSIVWNGPITGTHNSIAVKEFPAGVYFVQLSGENGVWRSKIVKR